MVSQNAYLLTFFISDLCLSHILCKKDLKEWTKHCSSLLALIMSRCLKDHWIISQWLKAFHLDSNCGKILSHISQTKQFPYTSSWNLPTTLDKHSFNHFMNEDIIVMTYEVWQLQVEGRIKATVHTLDQLVTSSEADQSSLQFANLFFKEWIILNMWKLIIWKNRDLLWLKTNAVDPDHLLVWTQRLSLRSYIRTII